MAVHNLHDRRRSPLSDSISEVYADNKLSSSQPPVFYASEENSLTLSGVGVFSPAASQPPSPTISRRHLPLNEMGAENLRQRAHQLPSSAK